jgi:hypothetical protein
LHFWAEKCLSLSTLFCYKTWYSSMLSDAEWNWKISFLHISIVKKKMPTALIKKLKIAQTKKHC